MTERTAAPASNWTPPPRPDWLAKFLEETAAWNIETVVPLDASELIETAQRNTGLKDFGVDDWREPFEILVRSLNEEAELHLFGRLWTRHDLLLFLENRLKIEETYRLHPEIEDEVIDRPVFVTGLPRSGTSILFELLAQDRQFLAPANWEFVLPCPPPEAATYRNDPRIPQAHHLITQMGRVAPTFQAMHEMGAWIPNECGVAFPLSFRAQHLAGEFQIPSYA
ncbi:MAG TPA: sulfotransferase, partial [Pedomonas sp.]|uniref:sulfotransferase n=1 Tax=Pedomonas sp. TaxID=2976421 RepID=UPI002F3FABAC